MAESKNVLIHKSHKYVAKVDISPKKKRYFYSNDAYNAYLNNLKSAKEKVTSSVSDTISTGRKKVEEVIKNETDLSNPNSLRRIVSDGIKAADYVINRKKRNYEREKKEAMEHEVLKWYFWTMQQQEKRNKKQ